MKLFKVALAALIVLINLAVAQPSWADRPNSRQLLIMLRSLKP
ncbi:hypothetical protein [Leptolyngbya sp. FACHB-261]|nr:hypothetical protein [Leptolyngbya sp. FACHB-261]